MAIVPSFSKVNGSLLNFNICKTFIYSFFCTVYYYRHENNKKSKYQTRKILLNQNISK